MKLDFADYIGIVVIGVCSLGTLIFAVGYVGSVMQKHYAEKRVQRNNELWLSYLLDDRCDDMLRALHYHSDDFLTWMVGLPGSSFEESVIAFDTYINLLNTCSLLEIDGIISEEMFWSEVGRHLKAIAACEDLCEFITTRSNQGGLRRKLLELEQRRGEVPAMMLKRECCK